MIAYSVEAEIGPILPAMHEYTAALDRVRVRDRRLRSGRAGLRLAVRAASGLKPAPADICAQLVGSSIVGAADLAAGGLVDVDDSDTIGDATG